MTQFVHYNGQFTVAEMEALAEVAEEYASSRLPGRDKDKQDRLRELAISFRGALASQPGYRPMLPSGFRIGDKVRVRIGGGYAVGTVVEPRHQLFKVTVEFPTAGLPVVQPYYPAELEVVEA